MKRAHAKYQWMLVVTALVLTAMFLVLAGCAKDPEWKALNDQLIEEHGIELRTLASDPETNITSNLPDGEVVDRTDLGSFEIAPGVTGNMYWGRGNMVNFVTMDAGAEIPQQTLSSERIMIMSGGSVEHLVNGSWEEMLFEEPAYQFFYSNGYVGYRHCLYLEEGSEYAVRAGDDGASFVEFYSPVREDYVALTGKTVPANAKAPLELGTPNFPSGEIFNYYEIQNTLLVDGAWSKIINGKGVQVSNIFMYPGSVFDYHIHPEEQLMTVLDGSTTEWIMDTKQSMTPGSVLFLPSQMVHGAENPATGCNAIDVFYPVRADYTAKMEARYDAFHAIIPEGTKPQLISEGYIFTEGPTWMNGELYFSNMFFDIPAGTWALDPSKSQLVALSADGSSKRLVLDGKMQTNGLMAMGNGNIAACDMQGHRVVEIAPNGRVVKTLASKITAGTVDVGKRLDGPNDLVIDAKGGIYFTDPQFINGDAARTSKTLNYIRPDGEVICVIENPGNAEIFMMNGVLLSPDGKTLYVNNTYHHEGKISEAENWVYAFDVNDDGTLSNKRRFAQMFLPVAEWMNGGRSSCADGMTMDAQGNLYVATTTGVQIFDAEGTFIGNIFTPTFPVSICFGGDNFDTLYITAWDKIYSVKTNVKGLVYPLQSM